MGEACNAHEIKQRRIQDNGCKTRTHEIDLLRDMELFYVVSQVFTNFYLGLFHPCDVPTTYVFVSHIVYRIRSNQFEYYMIWYET